MAKKFVTISLGTKLRLVFGAAVLVIIAAALVVPWLFMGRLADYMYKHDHPELAPGNSLYHVVDHKNSAGDQAVANSEYVACDGARKDSGVRLIREIAAVFANYDIHSEILAASVRNAAQLTEVLLAGADILTVPADILTTVADHPLSDAGMVQFDQDAQVFAG